MSLPTLYSIKDLMDKKYLVFVLGFTLSIVSIFFAIRLFPQDPGIVAVAFVSLMSLRIFVKFFDKIKDYDSMFDYSVDLFKFYLYLFFGVFLAFLLFSYILSDIGTTTFFQEQIRVFGIPTIDESVSIESLESDILSQNQIGNAIYNSNMFQSILFNNIKVLFFCFIISFFFGSGALFILLWNSSVWATIFGFTLRNYDFSTSLIYLVSLLPHAFLEASSYILVSISGVILSESINDDNNISDDSMKFVIYLIVFSLIILAVAGFIEVI